MDQLLTFIQKLELHPVVDHFTIGLLFTAVLIDLVAGLAPESTWIRKTALTLTILGALSAGASFGTGDMETDRIWKALGAPAHEILKRHAMLGEYMAIAFGVLAVWRILIQAFAFMEGSRTVYLIVAISCASVLGYVGHLGGSLVYNYGAGTALMGSQPIPDTGTPAATPSSATPSTTEPAGLPTVSVPTATQTPVPAMSRSAAPSTAPASPSPQAPAPSPQAASPSPTGGATL
jgi:uncharacterized membrane protein